MNLPCSNRDRAAVLDDLAADAADHAAERVVARESRRRGLTARTPSRWVSGAMLRYRLATAENGVARLTAFPKVGDAEDDFVSFLRPIPRVETGDLYLGRTVAVPLPEAVARLCGAIRDCAEHGPLWLAQLLTGRYPTPRHVRGHSRTWEAREPQFFAWHALARRRFSWERLERDAVKLAGIIWRRHKVWITLTKAAQLLGDGRRGVKTVARVFARQRLAWAMLVAQRRLSGTP